MNKATKSLLASFAVFGLVAVSSLVTVHSTRFHRFLLSTLRRATHWDIQIQDSHIRFFRGILELKGVKAHDPKRKVEIATDRLTLDLSSLSFLRGKIIVSHLNLERPTLIVNKTGEPSPPFSPDLIDRFFQKFEKSWILQNIFLEDIGFSEASIEIHPPPGSEDAIKVAGLGEFHAQIEPTLLRRIEVTLHANDLSGFLPKFQTLELDLTAKRDGLSLHRFAFASEKVSLAVKGNWDGDIQEGSLRLSGEVLIPKTLSETLRFDLAASLKDKKADITSLKATLEKAQFEAKGTFDVASLTYDLNFKAHDLALESIFQKLPSPVLGPAKGIGSVEGKAMGQLPELKAQAKATIKELHHGALHNTTAEGTLNFHWPELDWDADLKPNNDGRVEGHVKGGVAFKILKDPEYEGKRKACLKTLDLSFQGGDLKALVPTLNVTGNLDGALHLHGVEGTTSVAGDGHGKVTQAHWFLGPMDLLDTDIAFLPKGKIVFTKTSIHIPKISDLYWPNPIQLDTTGPSVLFSGQPMDGFTVKGRYEKESGFFKMESYEIRRGGNNLHGDIGIRKGGASEARMSGTANLEGLSLFPSFFREARGLAKLDLNLTGSTDMPSLKGRIEFLRDEIDLRGYSGIHDLQGILTLDGPWMSPDLTGYLGDGQFHLKGRLRTQKFQPEEFDLALKGSNLTLSKTNNYRIDFDADVALQGRLPAPRLQGRIDIIDGRYTKPFVVRELVMKPFEESASGGPDPWTQTLNPIQLDLKIRNSGDLRIRNNVADLLLQADLQMDGTYERPKVRGALTTSEGKISFLGEDFVINEGRLDFIDPAKKEPYLRLTAQQDVSSQYTVLVEVKGFLSNLEVILSSNPPLPRDDIISLLSTGLTQEEFRQSGRSRRALGAGMLAGEISGLVERQVSKRTGLDVFKLEASESGSLSKVAIGKNVTDRLTLEFLSDFAPETAERSIQANYYLTDNILLKGFQSWQAGTSPHFNVNISFRFRVN